MIIRQGSAALDVAGHEDGDTMTGVVGRDGYQVHGGLAVPMTGEPVTDGDGLVVINVQGVANPAGAVRLALRIDPAAAIVYARSTVPENSVAYELLDGAWHALAPAIGAGMWNVWTPETVTVDEA